MTGLIDAPAVLDAPEALPAIGAPSLMAAFERLDAPLVFVRTAPFAGLAPADQPSVLRRSAERALTVATARDVVCLPAAPDPTFVELLAGLGLGPDASRIVVPRGDPAGPIARRFLADPIALARIARLLPGCEAAWLAPGHSARSDAALAAAIAATRGAPVRVLAGSPALVARVDHKHVVRAAALELGVPLAAGTVVSLALGGDGRPTSLEPLQRAIRRIARRSGKAIVRGALGASGSSVSVTGPEGLVGPVGAEFAARPAQSVYLVEEHLEVLASPNVQVFIDPSGEPACVSVADQLLSSNLGYRGNAYPSAAETLPAMIESSLVMATWLSRLGYRGVLGLDFIEYADRAGNLRHLLAEINPRFNGSAQPVAMLERLNRGRETAGAPPIEAFAGGVVETRARSVPELLRGLGSRLYDSASGAGVLPFHTAGLPQGMCGLVAFAHTRDDAVEAFEELEAEGKDAGHAR